jgi:predicted nucleotidyltransferase
MTDEDFVDGVATRLAALPTVQAVTLGGSRATGTYRPDSDWDFAVYYRGAFDPQALRDIGWPGEVAEVGGWGGGVFNGGAWLEIDGRKVDVHYRDLSSVDDELVHAVAGRFRIEPLLFHLAGIPSYLVVAELATSKLLHGRLPEVAAFPAALRVSAPRVWWNNAELTLRYAGDNHAAAARLTECVGLLCQATCQTAHAVLAARGQWVTNEKNLLERAGLRAADHVIADAKPDPESLRCAVDELRTVCRAAVDSAVDDGGPANRG